MNRLITRMCLTFLAVILVATASSSFAQKSDQDDAFQITKTAVGEIRLNSTLGDVRKVFKNATFSRGQDEGFDVIEVKHNDKSVMWLSVQSDEQNPDSVDDSVKFFAIEVLDPRYKTAEGIGVGSTLKVAAAKYGNLKQIWIEGLTGEEVATFWNHPSDIDFKVSASADNKDPEKMAGIYVGDNQTTAVYNKTAVISSIKIPGPYGSEEADYNSNLIAPGKVGDVKIGMTIAEARAVLDKTMVAKLSRKSDGEGVALISVNLLGNEIMTFFAGEDDPEKPIDEAAKIEFIEVWSSEYRTREGATPKMLLTSAEQIYGEVARISVSEIESRITVEFERQPAGITFRAVGKDAESGIYGDGRMQTGTFDPQSMIYSIQVARIPNTEEPTSKPVSKRNFVLKEAAKNFDIKIGISGCESDICEGPALVQLFRKNNERPFQTITLKNMYLELGEHNQPSANLVELYGMNNSGVVFDDFDFDGNQDIALRNGNDGAYGGPSYDVYLYSNYANRFIRNAALTKLASENLGLFDVHKEKGQISTFTKSGCCWHQTSTYRVAYGRPIKVLVVTEDATGTSGKMVVTTERLVDGIWKKTVRTSDLSAEN